jgi:hypothetical protein
VIELDELLALETNIWNALRSGDAQADMSHLADDFLGVYPSGFADRSDHVEQLADGPTVSSFEILDPRVIVISDDHALLVYQADFRRPGSDDTPESMFVSSLWSRRNGQWTNAFSQDTPVGVPVVDTRHTDP